MEINIPPAEHALLAQQATAAGYDDVARYAADVLVAQAQGQAAAELPLLADGDLQHSLSNCDQSMAEFAAGEGLSVDEARRQTHEQFRRQSQ